MRMPRHWAWNIWVAVLTALAIIAWLIVTAPESDATPPSSTHVIPMPDPAPWMAADLAREFRQGEKRTSEGSPAIAPLVRVGLRQALRQRAGWASARATRRHCVIASWGLNGSCWTVRQSALQAKYQRATSRIYVRCGGSAIIGFVGASQAKARNIRAGWWGAGAGAGACLWTELIAKW